jgi:hypothetical protein
MKIFRRCRKHYGSFTLNCDAWRNVEKSLFLFEAQFFQLVRRNFGLQYSYEYTYKHDVLIFWENPRDFVVWFEEHAYGIAGLYIFFMVSNTSILKTPNILCAMYIENSVKLSTLYTLIYRTLQPNDNPLDHTSIRLYFPGSINGSVYIPEEPHRCVALLQLCVRILDV